MLESSGASFSTSHHQTGDMIFRQGDESNTVMHIEEGLVRLSVSSAAGKEGICGLAGPGSFLGEDVIGGCAFRRHTAIAIVPTELVVVSRASMTGLLKSDRALAQHFIEHTLVRKAALETELSFQLLYASEERLIHTLLTLAGCDRESHGLCELPRISQELIAEMVGTTRSRVNHFMSTFKKSGFLKKRGGVLQVDPARLGAMRLGDRAVSRRYTAPARRATSNQTPRRNAPTAP